MTDTSMFRTLFKILKEHDIYHSKINNVDIYLNFINANQTNNELENTYQNYTNSYDKQDHDWLYYYIYIILLIDNALIDKNVYETIINSIIRTYQ